MRAIALDDLDWSADAMDALMKVAAEGRPFDAYSLTERAELRNPPSPAMWGPLFRQAATDGVIRRVGFIQSRRPGRKNGLCRLWQVAA
jgi:hypothetical protein